MRTLSLILASAAFAATPVLAQNNTAPAEPSNECTSKLEQVAGTSGYKLVSSCGASAQGKNVQRAVQPISDEASAADGSTTLIAVIAAFFAGTAAYLAFDGGGNELADDDTGIDPASP